MKITAQGQLPWKNISAFFSIFFGALAVWILLILHSQHFQAPLRIVIRWPNQRFSNSFRRIKVNRFESVKSGVINLPWEKNGTSLKYDASIVMKRPPPSLWNITLMAYTLSIHLHAQQISILSNCLFIDLECGQKSQNRHSQIIWGNRNNGALGDTTSLKNYFHFHSKCAHMDNWTAKSSMVMLQTFCFNQSIILYGSFWENLTLK